jgi:hypothetical protein
MCYENHILLRTNNLIKKVTALEFEKEVNYS